MDLFRYLMVKNNHNYLKEGDLFSYKLAKGQGGGTYAIFEGTTINADNTRRGKMKLSLYGNTSQETTTGKNLLNVPDGTYTTGNYSITFKDGVGTPNFTTLAETFSFPIPVDLTLNAGTYTINLFTNENYPYFILKNGNTTIIDTGYGNLGKKTYTLENNATIDNIVLYYGSTGLTYGKISPQVESGNGTDTFEKFTYGASPNPSYPQQVHIVSGNNTITTMGENLINVEEYTTDISGGTTHTINAPFIKSGETYFISGVTEDGIELTNLNASFFGKDSSNNYIVDTGFNRSFTAGDVSSVTTWAIYTNSSLANKKIAKVMLNIGSTASTFTPYQSTSYPINLPNGMFLGEISTYKDRFFKAINGDDTYDNLDSATKETLDYGEWYLKHEIGKVVLDGSEGNIWNKSGTYQGSFYLSNNNSLLSGKVIQYSLLYCNRFSRANIDGGSHTIADNYHQGTCFIESATGAVDFWYDDGSATLEQWKTWLGNNNVILYYPSSSPTYTKITDSTLISQLNALNNSRSFDGQTNIVQTNNDLPSNLEAQILVNE